jgi:predicted extracellular nuclease
MNNRRRVLRLMAGPLVLALLLSMVPLGGLPASAAPVELFFSEYIEGSSYNKALEIYNGTESTIDLGAGDYEIEMYFNGATDSNLTIDLTGSVSAGDVYVVTNQNAVQAIKDVADQITTATNWYNGDDAVALTKGGVMIDVIGQIGTDPGDYWGTGGVTTKDDTLVRKETVCAGDANGADAFDPVLEWDGYAQDTFDGLGAHTATCNGTEPGQSLPLTENFDDCTLAGWEIVSVDADTAHTWSCNATYSNIDANGYGDSAPANEWLITPPLNLDAQERDTLTFRSYTNYTDSGIPYPQVQVLYSTDYDASGDPTGATWSALSGITFSPEDSGVWTDSGEVDLSGISGTNVYIAFQYQSSGTGSGTAANWRLDAINIFEGAAPGQPLPLVEDFDDCTLAGWEIVSVDEDTTHTWSCNATYSNIDANGYGDSAPANEWLITPPLNLNAQANDTLTFRNYTNYSDINYPQLHVLYSTDYGGGGDPTSATWTELSGINFSPEGSDSWVDSGAVDLSGINETNVYIAFQYVSSGTGGGSAANWRLDAINVFEQVLVGDWVLNEIHADPADGPSGDANGDGTRDGSQDEFVEIFNNSGTDVDVGGWTLSDGYGVRHTFPAGTVVPASCAIVVFGGGTPTGAFGGAIVQTANGAYSQLGLNNSGDTVTLNDGSTDVAEETYGSEGGDAQSLTRDPDVTGSFVKHSVATGSGGALFSPGTMVDGAKFAGCVLVNLIHDIQGSGATSPLAGSSVTIEGIVVGDFQHNTQPDNGDLRGFYVQEEDADADANPLTSEGVFVYDGYSPAADVVVGDFVRVKGQVAEYNGVTEITSLTEVTVLSSDNDLPMPATVILPLNALTDLEAYEGMSVTFPQALYISEYYNFDYYGETVLSSARRNQPTAVVEPGPDAVALAAENLLDRITLDDGRTSSNPDPALHPNGSVFDLSNLFRGGDKVQNVTGVVDYYNGYKIQPTEGADYTAVNERPDVPDDVGGSLKVASFNVLNYFTTIDQGIGYWICGPSGDMECRGADTDEEFERQRDKIIAALTAIDADVVGLIEIENHPEDVPTADLVTGLNDVLGAGTYDYIATGAIGTDAIRQALIYKPATVTPLGDFAVLDSNVDSRFLDDYNRPVPAQTFMDNATGGIFTLAVNHLKSKGSDCNAIGDPDTGDGSGNCNLTRKAAAEALVDWLAGDPTDSGDGDFLVIGDLNSYDKEDPIDVLLTGGYTDLVSLYQGEYAYSYVFDGQVGYLDHALANADLLGEVTGTTVWHINADEPDLIDYDMSYKQDAQDALYAPDAYRSSDHDPVIVGLDVCDEIAPTIEVTVSPEMLWPPNHKYAKVKAEVTVSDNFDQNPTVALISVTSDEPDAGLDYEDLPIDIVIVNDFEFKLRAERWDEGDGRTYTITYRVTDACGNWTEASATVTVPHDKGADK